MMVTNESVKTNDSALNGTVFEAFQELEWDDLLILILKGLVLSVIILSAILGNLLIIISVMRNHKLRIVTNYFIVSLAVADTLVAIFAMTFNAFYTITDRWVFPAYVCDLWNSCDVLFSTASILHLCCISVDRYYAIVRPFEYAELMSKRNCRIILACVWTSSTLISFIPIFTNIYTTDEHLVERELMPYECNFVVNKPYAVVSSCVSFWVPSMIMIGAYVRIFFEAIRQEELIHKNNMAGATLYPRNSTDTTSQMMVNVPSNHRNSHIDEDMGTPSKRHLVRLKKEHKAAKTLGIIMGVFIICWLPFFIWYVTESLCDSCKCPKIIVQTLFWVGYFNSSLNPIIYAYFNREFREAFKDTINVICRFCNKLCCNKNTNEIHFNCTYRSTQDIGLVENKCVRDI